MRSIWQDVRYSARRLLRKPLPNVLIVLSLALGIGANSAVFSLIDSVLLDPLPYPDPDRLVSVVESFPSEGVSQTASSPPNFTDLRSQSRTLAHLAALAEAAPILRTGELPPERLKGSAVTSSFFPALGMPFLLGRGFTAEEDRPGGPKAAVIGSDLWRQLFASNRGIVGKTIILDEEPYTVVGVVPSELGYPEGAQIWIPLALDIVGSRRGGRWLSLLGRLRPGTSLEQGQAEMDTLARRLEQADPQANEDLRVTLYRLRDRMTAKIRPVLLLLMAIASVVLLITYTNVASILLARFIEQEREIAIRTALGSSRGRLLRLFLTETMLLSLAGGAAGLLLSSWATSAVVALSPTVIPRQGEIGSDFGVLLFTLAVSLLMGLLIGLAPLLRKSSIQPAMLISSSGRSPGGRSLSLLRINRAVAMAEVALAVVALVAAGLLVRSFLEIARMPPGFQPDGAFVLDLSLPKARYEAPEQQARFYPQVLAAVKTLPGVEHAGAIFPLPMSGIEYALSFAAEGRPPSPSDEFTAASLKFISPDLLEAMGIPLLRGRDFNEHDGPSAPPVALINQTLARQLWPGESPIGRRIAFGFSEQRTWLTIVGVVSDVRYRGLKEKPIPEAYRPIAQAPMPVASLVLRSAGGTPISVAGLRQRIREVEPNLALEDFRTLRDVVARSTARERFQSLLMGLFAALAISLSTAGVFGVLSYAVTQRTHEFGVRMALGATPASIRGLVIRQGMQVVLAGLLLGFALSSLSSRALSRFLFGVGQLDLATLSVVALLVASVGILASFLPVRRATRVDPNTALHYE